LTSNVWAESERPLKGYGLEQPPNEAASIRHWYPVTASSALNEKLPLAEFDVAAGLEVIETVGATLSITKLRAPVHDVARPGASFACACHQ
jgi:hypothetical protein